MEQWKQIQDFEGYQISTLGRLMNKDGKILKNRITKLGYNRYALYRDKKPYHLSAHRLVALAFIDNPDNKEHVNHLDLDKMNNAIENLEWATRSENMQHSYMMGRNTKGRKIIGTNIKTGKEVVFDKIVYVEDSLGLCRKSVSQCLSGRTRTSGGYTWEFIN